VVSLWKETLCNAGASEELVKLQAALEIRPAVEADRKRREIIAYGRALAGVAVS